MDEAGRDRGGSGGRTRWYDHRRLTWEGVSVAHYRMARGDKPMHRHRALQVCVALGGTPPSARWRTDSGSETSRTLAVGECCVIPSWRPHTLEWGRRTDWVSFQIEPGYVEAATGGEAEASAALSEGILGEEDPVVRQLGSVLRTEFLLGDPARLAVESLANVLSVHLLRGSSEGGRGVGGGPSEIPVGPPGSALRAALDYVGDNLAEDLSVAEIARAASVSPSHLFRLFKEATGLSPHRYVVERRVERAKGLIERGTPFGEAALLSGFHDQSHMSRYFRRVLGATPGEVLRDARRR